MEHVFALLFGLCAFSFCNMQVVSESPFVIQVAVIETNRVISAKGGWLEITAYRTYIISEQTGISEGKIK